MAYLLGADLEVRVCTDARRPTVEFSLPPTAVELRLVNWARVGHAEMGLFIKLVRFGKIQFSQVQDHWAPIDWNPPIEAQWIA